MKSRRINSISYRMERNAEEQISLPTWWDKTQKNQSHFLHDGMKSRRINSISYTMGWRAEEPISVPAWRDESRRSNLTSYAMEWSAEESISLPTRWDKKLKNQSHFLHDSMNIRRVNLTSYTKFVAHVSTKSKLLYMRKYFSKSIRGSVGLERMLKNGQKSHDTVLLKN